NDLAKEQGATGLLEPGAGQDAYDEWLGALLGESGSVRRIETMRLGHHADGVIVDYAKKQSIGLIVMATHGPTGPPHRLRAGVTKRLLRAPPSPVLAIRP